MSAATKKSPQMAVPGHCGAFLIVVDVAARVPIEGCNEAEGGQKESVMAGKFKTTTSTSLAMNTSPAIFFFVLLEMVGRRVAVWLAKQAGWY
ncbi:MAG: hypothetical protein IH600_02840 [Bacteroidetes bacterium]|nr:hypothetical protein [Bacteroidota bacterium]